jgi:hypothetical protein
VGPRAGLDTEARGKSLASAGDRTPVIQFVVRNYAKLETCLTHVDRISNGVLIVLAVCCKPKNDHSKDGFEAE